MENTEQSSASLANWLRKLGAHAGADTLLRFAPSATNSIDLTHAHPSGLAQLLTGRKTRLSTLLREPAQYAAALKSARLLRAKIYELGADRGVDVGYLAAGTASWRVPETGRSEQLSAPVMLAAVSLSLRPSQDDFELQLTEKAHLNPALVRHLADEHGLAIDPEEVGRLGYMTARFDPHPVLERLRALTENVRSMTVEHHLLVSTFADLADTADASVLDPAHPVLAALVEASENGPGPAPDVDAGGTPLDERDPAEEVLVLDADQSQQEALDLIQAGHSLVVSAPPGTGQTQTALNAVAALVDQGKSVLVVAERRGTLTQFVERLELLQLGSLVLQLNINITSEQLRDQLVRAIIRNEQAAEPKLGTLYSTLTEHRHQLVDHVESLHNIRERWGCSPYQAMQSLARLTALTPAPSTTVRLKRSVLDSITDRSETTTRLRRAAELGSFSRAATESPWYGARLRNRRETDEAHKLAADLARDIPILRDRMQTVADHSQIQTGATFAEWGAQLDLLVAVRASLDKFTSDIFDRPVTDLISATASSGWRRERGIEMGAMARSRLRRVAKEYIRPGVHITDLHESLNDVQEQRTLWGKYATTQRHPAVPAGLAELNAFYRNTAGLLARLQDVLRSPDTGADLVELPVSELAALLNALARDRTSLTSLPERTLLNEQLREQGLGELLDDLGAREVGPAEVGSELELAWWQSALEAMISGDDYLAMSDGDSLRRLEAEYRIADDAHIASGPARLRWRLAENWRAAINDHRAASRELKTLLKDGEPTLASLSDQSGELISALVPVWAASPLVLPAVLPADKSFDTVILLEAESISLRAAVGAIARASQVIAFGDARIGSPQAFNVSVDPTATTAEPAPLVSTFEALAEVLPQRALTIAYRGVDERLTATLSRKFYGGRLTRLPDGMTLTGTGRPLTVEYIPNGTGMPSADHEGVESVTAEVNRVVELVFDHIRTRPQNSLAVITTTTRHAAKVADAIRLQMPNHPWAGEFFKRTVEPFRVVPVERASALVRDDVIFSLGYGTTPHGRAVHHFGPLSDEDGRRRFATAVTRARYRLHVLSCFRADDLDETRLSHGALDFYELIEQELAADAPQKEQPPVQKDPLVADLVERVRRRGAEVQDHYHGALDIVAHSSGHTSLNTELELLPPLAIMSDGTEDYRGLSVRERSRLRPQRLERLGWRYMPLWTIEVFSDPDNVTAMICGYLGLPGGTPGTGGVLETAGFGAAAGAFDARTGAETGQDEASQDETSAPADGSTPANGSADGNVTGSHFLGSATSGGESDANGDAGTTTGTAAEGSSPAGGIGGSDGSGVEGSGAGNSGAEGEGVRGSGAEGEAQARLSNEEPGAGSERDAAGGAEDEPARQGVARPDSSVIPTLAVEDDPRAWGDRGDDRDAWLYEQRPPHWN